MARYISAHIRKWLAQTKERMDKNREREQRNRNPEKFQEYE